MVELHRKLLKPIFETTISLNHKEEETLKHLLKMFIKMSATYAHYELEKYPTEGFATNLLLQLETLTKE